MRYWDNVTPAQILDDVNAMLEAAYPQPGSEPLLITPSTFRWLRWHWIRERLLPLLALRRKTRRPKRFTMRRKK